MGSAAREPDWLIDDIFGRKLRGTGRGGKKYLPCQKLRKTSAAD
jgi:hypothetical protein|tara:strand:- start:17 stop:148 length:132 start_codon:yes stop_codon:yes gene_type:complete